MLQRIYSVPAMTLETIETPALLLDAGKLEANCRRMRERSWGAEPCVIALTGWGQEEDRRRAEEAGFDGHLLKPVDPAALTRLISELPRRTSTGVPDPPRPGDPR